MDYKTARSQIRSGDVIAFTHEGFNSLADIKCQAVRAFTRSEFSHVGIAWPCAGRVFILEAVVPSIRIFPLSHFSEFFWLPTNRPLAPEAEEKAFNLIGQKYSKIEAVKGYFGITSESNHVWQCAEYVRSVLAANGLQLPGVATPTSIVHDLMELDVPIIMVHK